jgi:hypothetical protein
MVKHPTLVLNLPDKQAVSARADELANLAELAVLIQQAKGSRIANEFLLDGIGLKLNASLNEGFYQEALDYHLGLLFAHLLQPELANTHLARSHTLPTAGDDLMFNEQVDQSLRLYEHQSAAAARGMPPILVAGLPRSGSVSLTQSLAAALDAPVLRISTGHLPEHVLVRSWLNSFARGGAVTHDHFGATPFNLGVLRDAGWRDLFVLVRDPRAAAASVAQLQRAKMARSSAADNLESGIIEEALTGFIPWVDGWLAAQAETELRLHWIKYLESTSDMAGTVRRILGVLRAGYPALDELLETPILEVTGNLVRGDDEAWRSMVGAAGQRRLWEAISPQMVELLDLRP